MKTQEKGSAVQLTNYAVKRNRQQDLEVLASTQTKIENSPKKFKVNDTVLKEFEERKCSEISTLKELDDVAEMQGVTVRGKVVSLSPIEEVTVKSSGKVFRIFLQIKLQYIDVLHGRTTLNC